MHRLIPLALLFGASTLPAQSIWDSSIQTAPTFQSYDVKVPFNEKISQFSVPLFASIPVLSALTIDVGTAYATAFLERQTVDAGGNPATVKSEMSGLTDTQVRANYVFGQRSEERRVGKECRSRWAPDHEKKNKQETDS